MKLEQFKLKDSPCIEYLGEATVVTNGDNKVKLYETATTWVIEKFSRKVVVFRTEIQKNQPELLNKELKRISKR